MSLVVVGSVAYDGVETPHAAWIACLRSRHLHLARLQFFTKTRLVAVVGDDFADEDTRCWPIAASTWKVWSASREDVFLAGKYSDDMNDRVTLTTELNVFADFNPKILIATQVAIPSARKYSAALQRSVRQQMNGLRLAGGDTMNFWIKDFRDELLATIRDWDFLLINDSEARMLSGCENLRKAAQKILDMAPPW